VDCGNVYPPKGAGQPAHYRRLERAQLDSSEYWRQTASHVSNAEMHQLIEKMEAGGLSPKTIVNYSAVVKLVIASAVDADCEQIYPRKWNHDFIGPAM